MGEMSAVLLIVSNYGKRWLAPSRSFNSPPFPPRMLHACFRVDKGKHTQTLEYFYYVLISSSHSGFCSPNLQCASKDNILCSVSRGNPDRHRRRFET
jgi:hypothetical protein